MAAVWRWLRSLQSGLVKYFSASNVDTKSSSISTPTGYNLTNLTRERSVDLTIKVKRKWFGEKATIGEMFIDDDSKRFAYTLEDVKREVKIPGETCIPAGTYRLILDFSNRYRRIMPRLLNVPNFTGILIHSGNNDIDTHGCILVGATLVNENFIGDSRRAFGELFTVLQRENMKSKMWVSITEEPEEFKEIV